MLTKTPDYIISEYGYPKWQLKCSNSSYKCHENTNEKRFLNQQKQQSIQSPTRLLPLRETLSDYYDRLLQREIRTNNYAKVQKNKYNEQIKINENYASSTNNNSSTTGRQLKNQQQQQTTNTKGRHAALMMSLSGPVAAIKTTNLKLLEEQKQNELNAF